MAVHRRYDIAAIIVAVLCVVGYASFRSKVRLRPDMPSEFFDASRVPAERRAAELRIAKAYWNCAVKNVQWKYGYAQRLPDEPPSEFALPGDLRGNTARDVEIRAHYWRRLREVWGVSALWKEQYEWNSISFRESLESAGQWLEQQMRRITG